MSYGQDFALLAQRWHDTDHGLDRGPMKRWMKATRFTLPREDDFDPKDVAYSFRYCKLCDPGCGVQQHNNPFWFRVIAWESA